MFIYVFDDYAISVYIIIRSTTQMNFFFLKILLPPRTNLKPNILVEVNTYTCIITIINIIIGAYAGPVVPHNNE